MAKLEIEQDALVCFIDLHGHIKADAGRLAGWAKYSRTRLRHAGRLAQHCLARGIHMLNWEYRHSDVCKELEGIKFQYYNGYQAGSGWHWQANYSCYSHVYFCGISIDQCVMRRYCGYIWAPHPNKTVIRNCSLQGPAYMAPIDYVGRWLASEFAPPPEVIANQSLYGREFGRYKNRFTQMFDAVQIGKWTSMDDLHQYSRHFLDINEIRWGDWHP